MWEIGIHQRSTKGIIIESKKIILGKLKAKRTYELNEDYINLIVSIKEKGKSLEISIPNRMHNHIETLQDTATVSLFNYQYSELKLFLSRDSFLTINSTLLNRVWLDTTGVILNKVLSKKKPSNIELTLFDKDKREEQFFFKINPRGLQEKINEISYSKGYTKRAIIRNKKKSLSL